MLREAANTVAKYRFIHKVPTVYSYTYIYTQQEFGDLCMYVFRRYKINTVWKIHR